MTDQIITSVRNSVEAIKPDPLVPKDIMFNHRFRNRSIRKSKMKSNIFPFVFIALLLCSCHNGRTNQVQDSDSQTEMQDSQSANPSVSKITAEMAYEGVDNYCHKEYDWSVAKDNPDMMYLQMGEETETEYQVVFRSYTGAFVYFYVDKTSGTTKMVEKVPGLGVEEDDGEHQSSSGTINLFDYIGKKD